MRWSLQQLAASSVRARILRGGLASFYEKAVTLLVQAAAIPVLTAKWGAEGYGNWLLLMTIPMFLQLGDLGIGTAAGVELTGRLARGDHAGAREIVHAGRLFVTLATGVLALLPLGYAGHLLFASSSSAFDRMANAEMAWSLVIVTVYSVSLAHIGLMMAVCRSSLRYATAAAFNGSLALLEGLVVLGIAWSGGTLTAAMLACLAVRLIGHGLSHLHLRHAYPWLNGDTSSKSHWSVLKRLASPSFANVSLTLAGVLVIQGTLMTLGGVAGSAAVAVLAAARLLTRVPLQFSGLALRPSVPELSRALALGDPVTAARVTGFNLGLAAAVTVPSGILLVLFGPLVLATLSGGRLHADPALFALCSVAVCCNALWTAAASPFVAINRQGQFSYVYLLLAFAPALVPLMASDPGVLDVALAMAVIEAVMFFLVAWQLRRSHAGAIRIERLSRQVVRP